MSQEISSRSQGFFNKLTPEKSPKEKKQTRLVLLFLFGLTVLLIGVAIIYREWLPFWQRLSQPTTVVSEQLTSVPPTPTPAPKFLKEKEAVLEIIKPLRGKYGVYFQELENNGNFFEINGREKFPAASLIKLPTMLALYRGAETGEMQLDEVYKLQAGDKNEGAGSLQYKPVGYEITFRKMAELMGKQSDNTAFNIISRKLSGEKIQGLIDALGMRSTSFAENETSPEDIGLFFRKLYSEGVIYAKDKEEILSFLTDTIWEERIPAGVPKGVKVSHKIGTEVGVISDAGIVFAQKPFILVLMSQEANEIEAKKALPEITQKIYTMISGL